MSWNNGDSRNLSLRLKPKLDIYHVVLSTTQNSPHKITGTIVEVQLLPKTEGIDCEIDFSRLKWTAYNCRLKVCVNYKTDSDKFNIVRYRFRNSIYLKGV